MDEIKVVVETLVRRTICSDETFDTPRGLGRYGKFLPEDRFGRPPGAREIMGIHLAGHHHPEPERLVSLAHDCSNITDYEKWLVSELVHQLSLPECHEFLLTTNATPKEIARLWRAAGVCDWRQVNWINQFSSDPDWRPDFMLMDCLGSRYVRVGPFRVPIEEADAQRERCVRIEAKRARSGLPALYPEFCREEPHKTATDASAP